MNYCSSLRSRLLLAASCYLSILLVVLPLCYLEVLPHAGLPLSTGLTSGDPCPVTAARRSLKHEIYATLLTGQSTEKEDMVDHYYNSTRILIHRLLRDPRTKDCRPVVVFVTPDVEKWKRQRLREDGAIVRQVRILSFIQVLGGETPDWMKKSDSSVLKHGGARELRWKDQFTKLQLLGMTEYDKIVCE